jgi:hypothetical protein
MVIMNEGFNSIIGERILKWDISFVVWASAIFCDGSSRRAFYL